MLQFTKFAAVSALGLLLLTAIGCGKPDTDPAVIAAHQTRLTLSDEPDGVQTVADVRAMLLGNHDDHDGDHDHDGDGHPDHDAEDHDAHDDHDDHDHDGHGHGGDHADHDAKDHDTHDAHGDHDHAHDDHDHSAHAKPGQETETKEVTVVGHIGGGLTNPWTMNEYPIATSQAVLFLADPEAVIDNEASGHKHAPGEECAFCAKNAPSNIDKLAMVQFVDANGDVLKIGTKKLFDVKENDMVVIHGQARVTAGGILVIDAEGLYIRN